MLNIFNWLSVNYLVATAVSASTILWVCLGRLCPRMIKFAPSRTIFLVRPRNGLQMNRSSPDSPSIPSKLIQMLQNKTSRVNLVSWLCINLILLKMVNISTNTSIWLYMSLFSCTFDREEGGLRMSPGRLLLWLQGGRGDVREPVYRLPVWSSWFLFSGRRHKATKVLVSVNVSHSSFIICKNASKC